MLSFFVCKAHTVRGPFSVHELKLCVSSTCSRLHVEGGEQRCHASSVASHALHPMFLPASFLPTFLRRSIAHSAQDVWNVSVIAFGAFFCNKRGDRQQHKVSTVGGSVFRDADRQTK